MANTVKKPLETKGGKRKCKRKSTKQARANRAANMRKVRMSQESKLTVALRMQHFVNGIVYGPGKITILRSLATQFAKEEAEQIAQQRNLFNGRGVIIGKVGPTGFHSLVDVDPDTFELPMDGSNLAVRI